MIDRDDTRWVIEVIRNPDGVVERQMIFTTYTAALEVHERCSTGSGSRLRDVSWRFRTVVSLSALRVFLHPGHTIDGVSVPNIRGVSGIQDTPSMVSQ